MLPPVCYICGKSCSGEYGLCESCMRDIKIIPAPHCIKCGRRVSSDKNICGECCSKTTHIDQGLSCCLYEGSIKESIHLFKYKGFTGLIDIFGELMASFLKKNSFEDRIDLIVPVPMHPSKRREKRYNHADILAHRLSRSFSVPTDCNNLKKIRWTSPQSEMDKKSRFDNIKDTFLVIDKNIFSGKNILVVDDVYTTGATVNECAKVLKKAGSCKVFSFTLARGA